MDDVSLTVARGTVTGLTGPSGSGKSSLLAVTAALIKPDAGRAVIDGVDATSLNARGAATLRRERIGIVFQQANLVPSLTALEQLVVMDHLGGARRGESVIEKARALLDAVGMAEHAHKRPHQLSGGQRQRVNIARALVNDPAALVVDEPTSALDQERGKQIMDLIVQLTTQRQTATLLVTHDLSLAPAMHEIVHMRDGRLVHGADRVPA